MESCGVGWRAFVAVRRDVVLSFAHLLYATRQHVCALRHACSFLGRLVGWSVGWLPSVAFPNEVRISIDVIRRRCDVIEIDPTHKHGDIW